VHLSAKAGQRANTFATMLAGEVSALTPVFPSWDRVIAQLRQATAEQKASVAALARQQQAEGLSTTASIASAGSPAEGYGYIDDSGDDQSASASVMGVSTDEEYAELAEGELPLQQDTSDSDSSSAVDANELNSLLAETEPEDYLADEAASPADEQPQQQQAQPDQPQEAVMAKLQSVPTPGMDTQSTSDAADADVGIDQQVATIEPQAQLPSQQQQQQQVQQQQSQTTPAGAFPAKPGSPSSSTTSTSSNCNQVSQQSVSEVSDGADIIVSPSSGDQQVGASLQAFPALPRLIGPKKGQPTQQARGPDDTDAGTSTGSSAGSDQGDAAQAHASDPGTPPSSSNSNSNSSSSKQRGPRVKLLPPSQLSLWAPHKQNNQQQPHHATLPLPAPSAEENRKTDVSDSRLAEQKIPPREPLHVSPLPSFTTETEVDPGRALLQIPSSFMGISHEWNHVADMNAVPGYKAALKLLSSFNTGKTHTTVIKVVCAKQHSVSGRGPSVVGLSLTTLPWP
jgi:hypothetical protein